MQKQFWGVAVAGATAGAVTGLFGAGGGMVLIPLLTWLSDLQDEEIFPASISVIAPLCIVSLILTSGNGSLPWKQSLPWLTGSAAGGLLAGLWGRKIPVRWLHKGLGILILWGGLRYLRS